MATCGQKFCNCICCISTSHYRTPYEFEFSGQDCLASNAEDFQSNFVTTSKYTWYSFLPKALIIQFKRIANIYFLLIAVLQTIPIISPLDPFTAWAPLIIVLGISMIREGYEDFQRHKSDNQMNHETLTYVRRDGKFVEVQWSKVVVGDIVKVQQEEIFPTDLILLNSSTEGGVAFIETASLDGQKNLKPRNAYSKTMQAFRDPVDNSGLNSVSGEWKGIIPDKQLHKFSSTMILRGESIVYEGDKQLLYRGAKLKNTKWILGLAIYTGKNTKIMLNSESSSEKMSQIQIKVNKVLIFIFLFQMLLCLIVAILYGTYSAENGIFMNYVAWTGYSIPVDAILIFLTYFVLINTMIPISLVVSIEIVKVIQSIFIKGDNLMYSEFRKKKVDVKSASLNEQLGQIEYVFSDKTGTLTMNLMEFKIAVIGNKMFGDLGLILNDPERPPQTEKGFKDDKLSALLEKGTGDQQLQTPIEIKGGQNIHFSSLKNLAQQYFTALSTAHEVVADVDKKGKLIYQGPSPDEISLVEAAKEIGYQFVKSTQSNTYIKVQGVQKQFQLLQVFPFTSDRKRMSVVVRQNNGPIKMYMKGADSIVKQRLASDSRLNLDDELNQFSRIGLRTLLVGMRTISDSQYQTFRKNVEALPPTNKEEAYNALISGLESNLYIIGATAVLDRLQDFVPETIRDLIRANIKVWMLTGDKMETAENIAKSCNLIQSNFQILRYVNNGDHKMIDGLKQLVAKANDLTEKSQPKGLLIEGADLTPILASEQGKTELANLAKNCEAVVCCRLLPIQKAQVVSVVRQKLNKITLSIGDGANDVPMIKTAHIGVGLFGQEGMGAVQASDYALPEFRMLWRLLLVHGRWNYIRISEMILYFFYKNMLFTVPQLVLAFYCAYSGQTLFDDYFIAFYNLLFTSVPLVIRAFLEQDVNYVIRKSTNRIGDQPSVMHLAKKSRNLVIERQEAYLPQGFGVNKFFYRLFPKIYFIGQQNCIFNYSNFFLWVIEAFVESILLTVFVIYTLGEISLNGDGLNSDLWIVGLTIYSTIIIVVTFKLATHTRFWSGLLLFAIIFISIGLYLAYMWISNYYFSDYINGTNFVAWTSGQCYFIVLFGICFLLFVDGIVIHIDLQKSGVISKMRTVIAHEKHQSRTYYEQMSLRLSQGLSHAPAQE